MTTPEDIARGIVSPSTIGLAIAAKYRTGVPGVQLAREISAAITEALRPSPVAGWQDISTAPKDGTQVLLGRFVAGDEYDGRIRVDWWRGRIKHGFTGFGHFNPQYWPPTHWMPLPSPPVSGTGT